MCGCTIENFFGLQQHELELLAFLFKCVPRFKEMAQHIIFEETARGILLEVIQHTQKKKKGRRLHSKKRKR